MYHICPAQCQIQLRDVEEIYRGDRFALPAEYRRQQLARAWPPRRAAPSLAWISAATPPAPDRRLDLGARRRRPGPALLTSDRNCSASLSRRPSTASARTPAASDLGPKRRAKTPAWRPRCCTVAELNRVQTPRPGSLRRMSGTTTPSADSAKRSIASGDAFRPGDDAGPLRPRFVASSAAVAQSNTPGVVQAPSPSSACGAASARAPRSSPARTRAAMMIASACLARSPKSLRIADVFASRRSPRARSSR